MDRIGKSKQVFGFCLFCFALFYHRGSFWGEEIKYSILSKSYFFFFAIRSTGLSLGLFSDMIS